MKVSTLSLAGGLLAATLTLPSLVWADVPEALETLEVSGHRMPVKDVRETPMADIYEVRLETGETFYTNAEGNYFLVGDLYEKADTGLVNLTEKARNTERASRVEGIPDDQRVTFRGTETPQAKVVVFTDTTCPYCQRLHEEVPRINELGIEVDYLAFPRGGMDSPGARELQEVWCADNSSEALSAAFRDESLESDATCDNPVEEQYHLGLELGVQGTPAIILPDGRLVPGYVPAERLAAMLGLKD
ncbi:DsbC family protein [Halomonas caseinilytica]|uniref:Thiol:disulfide interchange protein n=1 Tax=Halomonas caseinilytica TaxID=438744 RepID=A0A1M6QNK2_9GAMM|nr:DsbC family protein [Halomonas caseinilytica]SEL98932.1 thiol:disulfide interchange protein DsbC [Halomonas caseinilytica]SHK21824.1 Thiol:disulfide interchange protein DsbC [Halomonas caseinilytica]